MATAALVAGATVVTSWAACPFTSYREHDSNTSPSKRPDHQKGQGRRGRDYGGEKGDAGRRPPSRPPGDKRGPGRWKGPWPPPPDAWGNRPPGWGNRTGPWW